MSFSINSILVTYPVGSVCAYGGSTDPDGWVICDGSSLRDYNSKYDALITMGLGSNTGGKYIPPDLRKYTMIGTDTNSNLKTSLGNDNNVVPISSVPKHNHTVSITSHSGITAHNHTYVDFWMGDNGSEPGDGDRPTQDGSVHDTSSSKNTSSHSHSHTSGNSESAGSSTDVNILNSCYVINWILKY
jgi:microcystin-dependent protein